MCSPPAYLHIHAHSPSRTKRQRSQSIQLSFVITYPLRKSSGLSLQPIFNSLCRIHQYILGCRSSLGNKSISWCWDNYLSCAEFQCDSGGSAFLHKRVSKPPWWRSVPTTTCVTERNAILKTGAVPALYRSSLRFSSQLWS